MNRGLSTIILAMMIISTLGISSAKVADHGICRTGTDSPCNGNQIIYQKGICEISTPSSPCNGGVWKDPKHHQLPTEILPRTPILMKYKI